MYRNYINLGNFNDKLVTIFLEDGKTDLDAWWLHHGGSISSDHMVSPKSLSNKTQR
jgi:hypothetical protein